MLLYVTCYLLMALDDPEYATLFKLTHASLNFIVYVAIVLDIFVVALLLVFFFLEDRNSAKPIPQRIEPRIILICGVLWILTSILWRIPFYLQGPLGQNFGPLSLFMVYIHEGGRYFSFLFLFFWGSIFLIAFLFVQDRYFLSTENRSFKRSVYGFAVLIGNFIIVAYSLNRDALIVTPFGNAVFFYWILMITWKLGITPIIGMWVAKGIWIQANAS